MVRRYRRVHLRRNKVLLHVLRWHKRQILLQAALTLAVVTSDKYSTDFKTMFAGP